MSTILRCHGIVQPQQHWRFNVLAVKLVNYAGYSPPAETLPVANCQSK